MFDPCVVIITMVWLAGGVPESGGSSPPKTFVSEVLPDREICEIHAAMRVEELKQDYGDLQVRYTINVQGAGSAL